MFFFFLQERQSSRLFEDFPRLLRFTPAAFGDCHSAFHQSPMPGESEPVCAVLVPEAQLDSSKVWLCKNALQGLEIFAQAWSIHSTQKINDISYDHLISDFSTYGKKRAQRHDDSLRLRHMDDVLWHRTR